MSEPALISSDTDTGAVDAAYGGGVRPVLTVSGATTEHQFALLASQNCRSEGVARALNIGSIYSWAKGNVSGNYSARQCHAWVPQSVNLASEECRVYGGFRGVNIASIYSDCTNESNANIAARYSYATGRNSGNLFSTDAKAGRGYGAELGDVPVVDGACELPPIISGGFSFIVGDNITFYDRAGAGTGASAKVETVDANGTILTLGNLVGGSNYSDRVGATVDNGTGDFSFNIGTINNCRVYGIASGNMAADGCRVGGAKSLNLASVSSWNDGDHCVVVASSGGGVGDGVTLSAVIGGNGSQVTANEAVVFGRNTINPTTRELAGGNGSFPPSSSNRKWSWSNATGEAKSKHGFTVVGSFADFGEYFENADEGIIEYGTVVMFDRKRPDKIVPWDGKNPLIVGVVSATIAFMADGEDFSGQDQFLFGPHGEPIYNEDGTPKENPDYIPRADNDYKKDRPEIFSPVGFKGKVYVNVPEGVRAGGSYAGMHVMKITTPFDAGRGYAIARCFI